MSFENYSVLMSIYKDEDPYYFKESIQSMIDQTLKPDEIVIVKDGELTTELNKVIEFFEVKYPSLFTIVPLTKNVGLGLALNAGLKVCKNELVARMDTDDIAISDRCEIQVNEFRENEELCIIGSTISEFSDDPNEVISSRIVPTNHDDIVKFSRRRNPFNHPSVMYKKSAVLNNGGYNDYRRNQDLDLFVRMLHNGCKAKNIQKPLLLFRANEDNLQRRKSWTKCSSYIQMIYNFRRKGYSTTIDLLIVTISQLIVFVAPVKFLDWLSKSYLRK